MTIANDSKVMPLTFVALAFLDGTPWLAQPPHVGVCSGATGGPPATTVDVLWDTGESIQDQAVATLLELGNPDASTISTYSGRVVRRTGSQSAEYVGTPVLLAKGVFPAQSSADFAIVKSAGPGGFFWASLVSDLEVVQSR